MLLSQDNASIALSNDSMNLVKLSDEEAKHATNSQFRKVALPDGELLNEIVHSSALFQSSEEEETCKRMVDELSDEEQSIAARTSYAFWAWEQSQAKDLSNTDVGPDLALIRLRVAMKEARRHLAGHDGDYDGGLLRFKATIQWRNEMKIDLLKACFSQNEFHDEVRNDNDIPRSTQTTIHLSEDDAARCAHFEQLIEHDLRIQKMAVRGHDKQKRPIVVKFCRETKWPTDSAHAEEGFFVAQLYIAERAVAIAEVSSMGQNERLAAIFDFGCYDSGNAPPTNVMVSTLKALQANYPERLGKAIVLDPPFWMQALMQIVNVFLASETRDKLTLVGGSSVLPTLWSRGPSAQEIRHSTVAEIVDPDQAMTFMLPNGKRTSALDVTHQLWHVPFFELYDSVTPSDTACEAFGRSPLDNEN